MADNSIDEVIKQAREFHKLGDNQSAEVWLAKAKDSKDLRLLRLKQAVLHSNGEFTAANEVLKLRAELGDIKAISELATNYSYGFSGFPKDQDLAVYWNYQAYLKGDTTRIFHLASSIDLGGQARGVNIDPYYWFQKAYDHGEERASFRFAQRYLQQLESGASLNKEGQVWLEKALALDDLNFNFEMAGYYFNGLGELAVDYERARTLYLKTSPHYDASFYWLAKMYDQGLGVPADLNIAAQYYLKSKRLIESARRLNELVFQNKLDSTYLTEITFNGEPFHTVNLPSFHNFASAVHNEHQQMLGAKNAYEEGNLVEAVHFLVLLQRAESTLGDELYSKIQSEVQSAAIALHIFDELSTNGFSEHALYWLQLAVRLEDPQAMAVFAGHQYDENDPQTAMVFYHYAEQAAKLGLPAAHRQLHLAYRNAIGVAEDAEKAKFHWHQAAVLGDQMAIDWLIETINDSNDYRQLAEVTLPLAQRGYSYYQYQYANALLHLNGGRENDEVLHWLNQAILGGNLQAYELKQQLLPSL